MQKALPWIWTWLVDYIFLNNSLTQLAEMEDYTDGISEDSKTPNECPGYDTKQSDGKAQVMLKLWGVRSTPSLPLLLGSLWPGVVTPDRVLSIGQIELFDFQTVCKQMDYP